jgi:phosphoribosylamine--glycine ligase/phosphoribosylformylglycinamidine cyclo-ligase
LTAPGIDLVAMSVNDLLAQGAESLLFLDYYATSKLDIEQATDFVEGVAEGCRQGGCALVGGETAEMPGMYLPGDYDAAGAALGAVERGNVLPQLDAMNIGDVLIGIKSNGFHSNGYSLIRKIVDLKDLNYADPAPWDSETTVGEELLRPTRIYVKPVIGLVKQGLIKGLSHITGGGLAENIPRMIPEHLSAEIDVCNWEQTPLFTWFRKAGSLSPHEYARTWNTGLGLVLVVSLEDQQAVLESLEQDGEKAMVIGRLVSRGSSSSGCDLKNLESWNV